MERYETNSLDSYELASKLSYLGMRSEPRENALASEGPLAALPLARAFSRDSLHSPK